MIDSDRSNGVSWFLWSTALALLLTIYVLSAAPVLYQWIGPEPEPLPLSSSYVSYTFDFAPPPDAWCRIYAPVIWLGSCPIADRLLWKWFSFWRVKMAYGLASNPYAIAEALSRTTVTLRPE